MTGVFELFFSWLPSPVDSIALGFVALFVIFTIIKVVNLILDILPFV